MSSDIISFQSEVEKRHVPEVIEKPSDPQYVIELEHENIELRNLLADAYARGKFEPVPPDRKDWYD